MEDVSVMKGIQFVVLFIAAEAQEIFWSALVTPNASFTLFTNEAVASFRYVLAFKNSLQYFASDTCPTLPQVGYSIRPRLP